MTNDGVGLPVRLHDLLLALAGRVDDDALTRARELLAVAEPDRAVELVVGVLLAGRIPVTGDERREIGGLLDEVRSDRTLADRLFAVEQLPPVRHRFTIESDPADGLAEVVAHTATVLPDVRSVRATWRSSPAGAVPGPLPQRVVLVDIGPAGFAPATAYRFGVVLRRAGVQAAVEVLTAGTPLSEYHAAAVTTAREVFFQATAVPVPPPPDSGTWFDGDSRDEAPVAEPAPVPAVEAEAGSTSRRARVDPFEFEGVQDTPFEDVRVDDGRDEAVEPVEAGSSLFEGVQVEAPQIETPRFEGGQPFPPKPVKRLREVPPPDEDEPEPVAHGEPEFTPEPAQPEPEPVRLPEHPLSRAEVTTELNADDLAALQAALADGPVPSSVALPPTVDAKLSDRERALLQQLHEELAQREQQSWPHGPEYVNGVPKPGGNGKFPG
ncbi:hypothetical protein [Saccharothrix obliqua]|uniref:hypothetical protein n=1 Tax=Saccharothrix obliqua TaxID=2861747 RepID=UPI001C5F2264|nr:hypothetical protein [Saccharothrix obliqua]MBW4719761.1 hypothetical protein [Saccharothrix obliqua]